MSKERTACWDNPHTYIFVYRKILDSILSCIQLIARLLGRTTIPTLSKNIITTLEYTLKIQKPFLVKRIGIQKLMLLLYDQSYKSLILNFIFYPILVKNRFKSGIFFFQFLNSQGKSTYIPCVHKGSLSHPFGNPRAARFISG